MLAFSIRLGIWHRKCFQKPFWLKPVWLKYCVARGGAKLCHVPCSRSGNGLDMRGLSRACEVARARSLAGGTRLDTAPRHLPRSSHARALHVRRGHCATLLPPGSFVAARENAHLAGTSVDHCGPRTLHACSRRRGSGTCGAGGSSWPNSFRAPVPGAPRGSCAHAPGLPKLPPKPTPPQGRPRRQSTAKS